MAKKEREPIQEDRAEEYTSMDHVGSIEGRVQALLESNEVNFNAWVLLISEVEDTSPDDLQKICLVYDSFLSEFPLCYGYWTRYAGHKARLCTMNDVEDVYEQAVKAASHSVHLWVSYCIFAILSFEAPADVRSFKKLVALLEEQLEFQNVTATPPEAFPDCEMTYMKGCGYEEISNVVGLLGQSLSSPEALKKYFSIGELLYQKSSQLDNSICCFEAHIQRQYFHIKPLDEFQVENWHEYLTFVEEQGNFDWTVKLYERCLIPCANYPEFWIRYVDFVDAKGGREIANDALERALKVFLKRIPAFHQYYSMFKEQIGDTVSAGAPFLQIGEDSVIDIIENVSRKANMEKRMGNIEAAQEIYDKAIKMAHEKQNSKILPLLYINFARFTFLVTGSMDAAKEVFIKGIQQNPCRLIIEGFINFITVCGGQNHVDSVDCKMAAILSPESDVSQALSSHDREEISQLYLKFVDLYGTIRENKKAWERHMKLFPHFMRPSSICDYSSNGFQIRRKKSEGPKSVPTNSPNQSSENPSKNALVKHLVENYSPINKPIIIPEETLKCELRSYGKEDNEKEIHESIAAEAIRIHKPPIPSGSEIDVLNNIVNESQSVAQIPDDSSEYHETEMPIQSYVKTEARGNLELPALDNLSIISSDYVSRQANTVTSHDNNAPQEVTSKEAANKTEDDGKVSVIHSSGEKHLKSHSDSQAKLQEDISHLHPASHATRTGTETEIQLKFVDKIKTNQALPASAEYTQTAAGGRQQTQYCYGVQGITDQNSMFHGYIQSPHPQQWQAHTQMQNQSGGTNLQMSLTQGYITQTPSLANSQVPQASHPQLQYHLGASQAYMNPGLAFLGQHMQHSAIVYTPDQQVQQASSQTQIQAYQNASQNNEQYGYYQNFQGFPPHILQYYQNFYYLQQQQRQQNQQMNMISNKQQINDPSEARSSQQELLENQEEQGRMQVQSDTQQHHRNLDEKLNVTVKQQNQEEKQEELNRSNQESMQSMNSEQSQLLYLQQQQHFYLQQQQHHQMYLQQQQLLQQQQHQELLVFQQQQLHLQHQQKQLQQLMPLLPSQKQQSPYPQQQHQSPLQQKDYQLQQQTNALEHKAVESNVYAQGKGDSLESVGQSANSRSTKQFMNSPNR